MNKLPVEIKPCPIVEAILEIRYSSDIPSEARFGMIYGSIGDFFKNEPIPLPIAHLPQDIRNQDPNLRYKAHHQFREKNQTLNVGPDVINFSTSEPYCGWKAWSVFFYKILETFLNSKVLKKVERIGLRYINRFEENIFEKIDCEVFVTGNKLTNESTNLRTEMIDDEFIKVLQIGNSITMIRDRNKINCSVIDIDVLYNIEDSKHFVQNHQEIIEKAHIKEKQIFFSLLKDSYLNKFNPIYGD